MPQALRLEKTSETSFGDVFEVLHRRKRLILGATLCALLVGVFLALRPRTYSAKGAIRVQPGNASVYRTANASDSALPADKIASEVMILQSHSLYMQVAQELDLVNNASFWGSSKLPHSLADPKTRERMGELMVNAIRVYHTPKDEIIQIVVTTRSPELSAKMVNTLMNDYVSYLFQMRLSSTKRTSNWLIGQLDDLKAQIGTDQDKLVELQGKLGVIGFDPKTSDFLATQSLDTFTKAASAATLERIVAEAKYRLIHESDPNLIEGEVNLLPQASGASAGGLLDSLRTSRAAAAANFANLSSRFGANYPDVKQAKAQLDELTREVETEQQRIRNQADLAYRAASANERTTNAEVRQQKNEVFRSRGSMVQYLTLLNDYNAHRTLYEGLIQRLREAGITSGLEAGEIDIVDLADIPTAPVPPGPPFLLAVALIAGLVVGCLLAMVVEVLDPRITTPEQAEKALDLPLLGVAPHLRKLSAGAVPAAIRAPRSAYAESLQVLRTGLLRLRAGHTPKVLLVTSAAAREGKTMTAMNLAIVMAQHRQRILLIDCDLHHGTLSKDFSLAPSKHGYGLADVLAGEVSLEQALVQPTNTCDLHVLTSGDPVDSPSVLLGSEAMKHLLATCRGKFDCIILDTPPVLAVADTMNLASSADAMILVLRSKVTTKNDLKRMSKLFGMADMPLAGVLLNDSRLLTQEQSRSVNRGLYLNREERSLQPVLRVLLLAAALLATAHGQVTSAPVPPPQSPATTVDRPLLDQLLVARRPALLFQPDDVISVQAYGIKAFTFEQRVSLEGTIVAPLIGEVKVGGLTTEQVQDLLSRRLVELDMIREPNLTVSAISRPSAVVTVSGAVARPGVFPAVGDHTLSDFLSQASGLNGSSGLSTGPMASSVVTLVRPTLSSPVAIPLGPQLGNTPYSRIPIFAGDEIKVGKTGTVYTMGAFHTQGSFSLKDTSETTVLNLVSMAGGVGYQAKEKDAYIIRARQGQKVVIHVPLQSIIAGKSEDIALQDQDILMLPTNQIKAAIKGGGAAMIVSVASAFIYSHTI